MNDWSISLSPSEDFYCDGCDFAVAPGYFIAKHANWPGAWFCLTCCLQRVRASLHQAIFDMQQQRAGKGP